MLLMLKIQMIILAVAPVAQRMLLIVAVILKESSAAGSLAAVRLLYSLIQGEEAENQEKHGAVVI